MCRQTAGKYIDFPRNVGTITKSLLMLGAVDYWCSTTSTSGVDGPINDADPSSVLRPLERVTAGGTPVVVIAHTGKGGSKDPMGPTAYKAWRRHGIHVGGSGNGPRKLTRSGNVGIWPIVEVQGNIVGSAVEYRLADGSTSNTSKQTRSKIRLDGNAEIADWIVSSCQRKSLNETARLIAHKFGLKEGTRRQHLMNGPLAAMLKREGEGEDTIWTRK
jgi:hypothetical protein